VAKDAFGEISQITPELHEYRARELANRIANRVEIYHGV
jgi:hypothetical protein